MSTDPDECGSEQNPVNVNYDLICIQDEDDDTILIPSVVVNETACGLFIYYIVYIYIYIKYNNIQCIIYQ